MRLARLITIAIAAISVVPVLNAMTGNGNQPFSIAISTPKNNVKAGDKIRVDVVLTNSSSQPVFFRRSVSPAFAEEHYTVSVHDISGKDAPETENGRNARLGRWSGSEAGIYLQPGEQLEEYTIISKLFDLSSPGEYTIQLSRLVSDNPKDGIVKSNEITVTVLPGPDSAETNAHPFSIAISSARESIQVGDQVRIHVVLTNVSSHDITVPGPSAKGPAQEHYTVTVWGPKRTVSQSAPYFGPNMKSLNSGEQIEEDDLLNGKSFDFGAPGKYVIQYSQDGGDGVDDYWSAKSNKVTITVTE